MAEEKRMTVFGSGLIWFGAAVSIAEIYTGTLFRGIPMLQATTAILAGHLLGGLLMYFAGIVGAVSGKSAMEASQETFGKTGGRIFASLNILQLLGWTAVMTVSGAQAAQCLHSLPPGVWVLCIGGLVLLWLFAGTNALGKINLVSTAVLFCFTLTWSQSLLQGTEELQSSVPAEALSWGEALELSVAMPISWLPLIADYTSQAARPRTSCLASVMVYSVISCWMYLLGMAGANLSGHQDIARMLSQAGLGRAAMLAVVLSTVTTTYLDVYSAGVSSATLHNRLPSRFCAAAVCLGGTALALFCRTESFESFLYWISSLFVPMATVQIADVLFSRHRLVHPFRRNLLAWAGGVICYRIFLHLGLPIGSTIPDVLITLVLWRGMTLQRPQKPPCPIR